MKHIPENASMQVKYRIQWQCAASVHSSWTLLQVANVYISSYSRWHVRGEEINNRYNIPYIDKCAKNI